MGKLAMKPKHYQKLKLKVFKYLYTAKIPGGIKKALSSMTIRWKIYWASGGAFSNASEYHYLNDNHIDSALKSIIKEYLGLGR